MPGSAQICHPLAGQFSADVGRPRHRGFSLGINCHVASCFLPPCPPLPRLAHPAQTGSKCFSLRQPISSLCSYWGHQILYAGPLLLHCSARRLRLGLNILSFSLSCLLLYTLPFLLCPSRVPLPQRRGTIASPTFTHVVRCHSTLIGFSNPCYSSQKTPQSQFHRRSWVATFLNTCACTLLPILIRRIAHVLDTCRTTAFPSFLAHPTPKLIFQRTSSSSSAHQHPLRAPAAPPRYPRYPSRCCAPSAEAPHWPRGGRRPRERAPKAQRRSQFCRCCIFLVPATLTSHVFVVLEQFNLMLPLLRTRFLLGWIAVKQRNYEVLLGAI